MKLKTLAVVTLVVLGCSFASAQIGTFSFYSAAGTSVHCNFAVITSNSGGVVAGYDNLTTYCELPINSADSGLRRYHT